MGKIKQQQLIKDLNVYPIIPFKTNDKFKQKYLYRDCLITTDTDIWSGRQLWLGRGITPDNKHFMFTANNLKSICKRLDKQIDKTKEAL